MTPTAMFIAGAILASALGLVIWAWITMARVEEELLRSLVGFEERHFEIGSRAATDSEGARWPIPG
jgi:hypothetical protein